MATDAEGAEDRTSDLETSLSSLVPPPSIGNISTATARHLKDLLPRVVGRRTNFTRASCWDSSVARLFGEDRPRRRTSRSSSSDISARRSRWDPSGKGAAEFPVVSPLAHIDRKTTLLGDRLFQWPIWWSVTLIATVRPLSIRPGEGRHRCYMLIRPIGRQFVAVTPAQQGRVFSSSRTTKLSGPHSPDARAVRYETSC